MRLLVLTSAMVLLVLAAIVSTSQSTTAATSANGVSGDVIPGQYIVVLVGGEPASAAANDMAKEHGLALLHVYSHALNGFAARVPSGRLKALQDDPRVASIEPDIVVTIAHHCKGKHPSCPPPTEEPTPTPEPTPSPSPSGQIVPTGVLRINGDLSSTVAGNGSGSVDVDVAVIDTGIDLDHEDLNVVGGYNCVAVAEVKTKGKPNKDNPDNKFNDGHGHGTHVAGTIGAVDNNVGVVGVAPGARLWAVRVLGDSGSGSLTDVLCGIDWVTASANVIEVANMSIWASGSDGSCGSYALHQAICSSVNAGVTYVVIAGNASQDAANYIPATYGEAITVSALADFDGEPSGYGSSTCLSDVDDTFANFSNYGADVALIAPGVCILSTWNDGGYYTMSGTSMASPHVAGAAAIYKANNPAATPGQVESAMRNSGNLNWDNKDDRDTTKEKMLDVSGF